LDWTFQVASELPLNLLKDFADSLDHVVTFLLGGPYVIVNWCFTVLDGSGPLPESI
jgi:hypothetical protein